MNNTNLESAQLNFSSGIPALDFTLKGLIPGDNVVLQVESLEVYIPFTEAFAKEVNQRHQPLVYFRFAFHEEVISPEIQVEKIILDPSVGFESFLAEIIRVIERVGIGGCYIFDCLSDLSVDWYSDVMLSNFFMIICPYLYKLQTIAYFALIRNHTALSTVKIIQKTAQIIMDIFRHNNKIYLHPIKVEGRHSPTMYLLHEWNYNEIHPISRSVELAEILAQVPQPWLAFANQYPDIWTLTFYRAHELLISGLSQQDQKTAGDPLKKQILRMAISRDPKLYKLAEKYLELKDLVQIGRRMIGTGLIGGKAIGMLVARAILRESNSKWTDRLEIHDSFFIGSDVYYSFLVQNECWWLRRKVTQHPEDKQSNDELKVKIKSGLFPKSIVRQFQELLDYYGQAPLIVRSSSLLEDAYGSSFSGKYESIFCANQGPPENRLEAFMNAVRQIYASSVNQNALEYRRNRGLLDKDEQMALLVMRVSGNLYGKYFFPQIAGVGFSFNPYVWNPKIDPNAGVLRLVTGLGTRAVDRIDDDYTKIVALNMPKLRLQQDVEDLWQYSQKKMDILDLENNQFVSIKLWKLLNSPHVKSEIPLELLGTKDTQMEERMEGKQDREDYFPWIMTFENLLAKTSFPTEMHEILQTLQTAYGHPVDIEFTANFMDAEHYRINLLQCRTFQAIPVEEIMAKFINPSTIPQERHIFLTIGPIIGPGRAIEIDRFIYIVAEKYSQLTMTERYQIGHLIKEITNSEGSNLKPTVLLGPGRWGTSSPELGIPASFSDINQVTILGEMAEMHSNLIPDVSLGTHFFNDLVEMKMTYFALHPQRKGYFINRNFLETAPNQIKSLVLDIPEKFVELIRVIDSGKFDQKKKLRIQMNPLTQQGFCYIDE